MFEDILKKINFENNDDLLLVSQRDDEISENQRKILYLAQEDYLADAVFFQKNSNQKYIPQFFIYDNTSNEKFNKIEISEIHKRLWSSEIVPLYFVIGKTEIKVFNTKQKVRIEQNEQEIIDPTDILKVSNMLDDEFEKKKNIYTPFLFQNGSFWETEYYIKNYLKAAITKESPFDILIANLHDLKDKLILDISNELTEEQKQNLIKELEKEHKDDQKLSQKDILKEFFTRIANRIVVFSILIKYLEEKKDEKDNSVFTVKGNIFQIKWNVKDYSELIKEGKFYELLNYLSGKFNGKIFELTKAEEFLIKNLPKKSLNHLSHFVDANYKNKSTQLYLWKLYSFRFLPVELISRIYEEFIPDTPGVVYTPPFLVDLLIDECMPLDRYERFNDGKFKIIDPACGSGIFCVSAYQRLIDWHIINEYKKTRTWNRNLKIETLKNILAENIFGIDKEQEAVNIAVFSLTLALLEKLTPKQLWEDLDFEDKNKNKNKKLKNLKEKNIRHDDFFSYLQTAKKDFDLVIGNPPFNPDGMSNAEYFKHIEDSYRLKTSFKIPDDNLALVFLDKSIEILKKEGLQCLILPSSAILYNDGAMKYRNHFLKNYTVPQIIDFTHLRRILFNKDVATCAFFAKKQTPEKDNRILHLISHRTTNEENKMFFVFDTYDFHFVPLNIALTQKYIWKSNLMGGGRLNWIVNRISRIKPTLVGFLKEKKQSCQWEYLDGYTIGKETANKDADFITGNYSIPENAFSEKGVDYSKVFVEKNKKFANKRIERIFLKPQILIKKTITKEGFIPIEIIDYNQIEINEKVKNKNILCFKDGITGIHYNEKDTNSAFSLYKFFANKICNKVLTFYSILTGSVAMVRREKAIGKDEIDNFPYPQSKADKQDLQLSEIEQIWQEDVLNYYIHQGKASKNNPLNENAGKEIAQEYAKTFTWLMNLNYNPVKQKKFKTKKITVTNSYIAVEFHYCKGNIETITEKNTEKKYQKYFEKTTGKTKKMTRIVEFIDFANNKIYYIKPLQKRYWLKSIADRDAMKCFADFGNNKFNERE